MTGADPVFFLGGGALISCSSSTPINHIVIFFFGRIPVVLENCRSSQGGGGVHPLHPPPRSAPDEEVTHYRETAFGEMLLGNFFTLQLAALFLRRSPAYSPSGLPKKPKKIPVLRI